MKRTLWLAGMIAAVTLSALHAQAAQAVNAKAMLAASAAEGTAQTAWRNGSAGQNTRRPTIVTPDGTVIDIILFGTPQSSDK